MKAVHWYKSTVIKMAKFDAGPVCRDAIIPSNLINMQVLRAIEEDMDRYEILCCLFFLIEDYSSGYKKLCDIRNNGSILKCVEDNKVVDWEDKLIEALCLLQNNKILLNLGIDLNHAHIRFLTNVPKLTWKINKHAKAFYSLFENLSRQDAEKLLDYVYRHNIPEPDQQTWPKEVFLELHLLWWIKMRFINVSGDTWTMDKLLKILKDLGMSGNEAYLALEEFNVPDNNKGSFYLDNLANDIRNVKTSTFSTNAVINANQTDDRYEINNGLVVIFNQMKFPDDTDYEYRSGSEKDCCRIVRTFKDIFGFKTEVHDNLGKKEIEGKLKNLHSRDEKYDCVLVFILSHGTYGNIVASDGKEYKIEEIKSEICSESLKEKPKILVIQACQSRALTTDGGRVEQNDVGRFEDVLVLHATIPGEQAVRDPQNGTWFIRVLCDVLVEMAGKSVDECFRKVIREFKNMKANIGGKVFKQVPQRTDNLARTLIFSSKARATSD